MQLSTVGRDFHPGYELRIWCQPSDRSVEAFDSGLGHRERFRLLLVASGAGILRLGTRREVFTAPTLFCLNELDEPLLESTSAVTIRSVLFHPEAINDALSVERLRATDGGFTGTQMQDAHMLSSFLERRQGYSGQLPIVPATSRRIATLLRAMEDELVGQGNPFWPCRARSYLIETLFIAQRTHSALRGRDEAAECALVGERDDVDDVITYLHTHYHEKITIEGLVRTFHTNRTTLAEQMRAVTGTSIMTYVTSLRIGLAATMLHDTMVPIGEVAERVGFHDLTHFGRAFRKVIGCSATEYRERFNWMVASRN